MLTNVSCLVAAVLLTVAVILPGELDAQVPGMGKSQQHEDWKVFCPGNSNCTAMFSGDAVRVLVGPNAEARALRVAVLVAANADREKPIITLLKDDEESESVQRVVMNISNCTPDFCLALANAEAAPQVVELFRTSRVGRIFYAIREGETISTLVSFAGFATALAAVEKQAR